MSSSPISVTDIARLALGDSITILSQMLSPLAAESRVAVATMPSMRLPTTVLISVAGATLRDAAAGRAERGIGAEAATTLARSTGEADAGA